MSTRSRWWSASIVLVAIALGAQVLVNVALNTFATRAFNAAQADVGVEYSYAWSLWPGHVSARDLEVRVHDSHVELLLTAGSVTLDFALTRLFSRELQLRSPRLERVHIRARATRDLASMCSPSSRFLPSIPPLTAPLAEVGDQPARLACLAQRDSSIPRGAPPIAEEQWRVDLVDVHGANLEELWIEDYRFEGTATVDGGFYLWPTVRTALPRSIVSIERGSLRVGGELAASPVTGRVQVELALMALDGASFAGLIARTTATVELGAELPSLHFLDYYLGPALGIDGGGGALTAHVQVTTGTIAAGTTVDLTVKQLRATIGDQVVSGSARLTLEVEDDGSGASSGRRAELVIDATRVVAKYHELTLRGDVGLQVRMRAADRPRSPTVLTGTRLSLDHVFLTAAAGSGRGWWGGFEVTRGHVTLAPALALDLAISTKLKDLRPLFAVYAAQDGLPGWVQDLLSAEGAHGAFGLKVRDQLVALEGLDLEGQGLRVRADLRARRGAMTGSLLFDKGDLTIGVELDDGRSHVNILDPTGTFHERVRAAEVRSSSERPKARPRTTVIREADVRRPAW